LDVVAGLLTEGLLDRRGVFTGSNPNLRSEAGKAEFLLSPASENGHLQDIVVTRQDVNEIQLAKGAIRAGIDILLEKAGLVSEDLDQMIVAGAFGTYIDIESAIRIGMFPDIPLDIYRQVGNAAGVGAKDLLISQKMRRATVDILDRLEYVELTTHADFQGFFMERLYF
jgi:uncharacterized 2Fe-2S/4Fe-4S cluster protein (DUF4445 family)